jgi:serine phosphatase RsbU (regulator of sigma subunit)
MLVSMLPGCVGKLIVLGCLSALAGGSVCAAQTVAQPPVTQPNPQAPLNLDGGAVALDESWKFHLGDDRTWASPSLDDSGWEGIAVDKPWGMQSHPNTEGLAWYRRSVILDPGQRPQALAILLPAVEDAYELYWNGRLVGTYGKLPPHPWYYFDQRPRAFDLGPAGPGVLAVRVWKAPFSSFDSGKQGGFHAPPLLGSPNAIADALGLLDYEWLRSEQFSYALNSLYVLVGLLSLTAWLKDRRQWVVFWMACFALGQPGLLLVQSGSRLPIPAPFSIGISTVFYILCDVSLWFLLLWLLDLRDERKVVRLVSILAFVEMADGILDGFATYGYVLPNPAPAQVLDGVFTAVFTVLELVPFYLIWLALARRKRLDAARWTVAGFAFLTQTLATSSFAFSQGSRFTGWTLGDTINAPLFSVMGNPINAAKLSGMLLLVALVYGVYQYSSENSKRQTALEQEYRNARAVQQVLIPEAIPQIPGFAIESVYKPAGEVGGDFFQILATRNGGVLAVIGDVSGKGMPAAMTVSLLVGTVRTLAHYTQSPAEILSAMNQRMIGRTQGGFTTCLVLRADADGKLTIANAGYIPPYVAGKEISVDGGLPLGLAASAAYRESAFSLEATQQLTLMTDGVVEARSKIGELFGFDRTKAISAQPAESISQTAQNFGQEDDITVLTLARLAALA